MQQYLDRCMTLLVKFEGLLDTETLDEAQHLMEHGEPSIGVEYLAHGVVEQSTKVPGALLLELRHLVMDQSELPPNLDEWTDR
jgi:hypothetical protein